MPPAGIEGLAAKADGVAIGQAAVGVGALAIGNVKFRLQRKLATPALRGRHGRVHRFSRGVYLGARACRERLTNGMPILILALSGRALAQAAKRAGADVMVSDFFGDMETRSLGHWHRLPGDLEDGIKSRELLDWVRASNQPIEGIVYGAGFEATPAVLGELAQIAPLIGNAPQIVAAVKDPFGFAELLRRLDLPHPEVAAAPRSGTGWLRKLRGGSGGTHIERATAASSAANDNHYFQAEAIGNPVSALFAANGRAARMLGLSAQWAAPTPAQPFRYGGCAGPLRLAPKLADFIERACHAITAATGLVGLNSLDVLATDDAFTILEINPRPGATLDVFDDPHCRKPLGLPRRRRPR